jgi:hypothetical protein
VEDTRACQKREEAEGGRKVIRIEEKELHRHLDNIVRGTVEDTLNAMPDAEADQLCQGLPPGFEKPCGRFRREPRRIPFPWTRKPSCSEWK